MNIMHHTSTANCHYLTLNNPKISDTGAGYTDTDIVMFSYDEIVLVCHNNLFYVLEGKHKSAVNKHISWFVREDSCTYLSSQDIQRKFASIMCNKLKE